VLAAFPRELLNGGRAKSVGTDDIKRDRAELEIAFPRFVIIHLEQPLYVHFSDRKAGWLAALRESGRVSGRPLGGEQSGLRSRVSVKQVKKALLNAATTQSVPAPSPCVR
jgi:hypothetical protein